MIEGFKQLCVRIKWRHAMFKKLIAIVLMAGFAGLTGCNTMSGLGKDVQKGGEKLENSAEKHK